MRADAFERELHCYQRLADHRVANVLGHRVPLLLDWSEEFWVIEMTIVKPPFLLDFAGAYLDFAPDFPEEVIEYWRDEKAEQFGAHWSAVEALLEFLQTEYGIHLLDINPGNITFVD